VPASGTTTPRYTAATGIPGNHASFTAVSPATDTGSPGNQGATIPTVSIGNAAITEGDSSTSNLALNVTRSDTATAFTVNYAVTGGSATSGTDYAMLANGTLTFPAGGAASLPINIIVNGDTDTEPDETVIVTLSNVVNTTGTTIIATANGTFTITHDDIISHSPRARRLPQATPPRCPSSPLAHRLRRSSGIREARAPPRHLWARIRAPSPHPHSPRPQTTGHA
jgi:hypothetical protein